MAANANTTTEIRKERERLELPLPEGPDEGWTDAKWDEAPWEAQARKIQKRKAKKLARGVVESAIDEAALWERRLKNEGLGMGRGKVPRQVAIKAEATPTNLTRERAGFDGFGRQVDDLNSRNTGHWEPLAFERMGLARPKMPRDLERGPGQDCTGYERPEHVARCVYRAGQDYLGLCPLLAGLGIACGAGCVCVSHSLDRDVAPITPTQRFFSLHECRPGCGCPGFESVTEAVEKEYVRPKRPVLPAWDKATGRTRAAEIIRPECCRVYGKKVHLSGQLPTTRRPR